MNPTARETQSSGIIVGSDSGSGMSSYVSRANSRRFSLDSLTGVLNQIENGDQNADQLLPFPLDRIDDLCSSAYITVNNMKSSFLTAYRGNLLKKSEKAIVKRNLKRIKSVKLLLKKIVMDVGRMKL